MANGQQEIQNNNFTEAIAIFNKIILEQPEHHLAYFLRGFAKMQLGDFLGAESDFNTTVMIHHGYSPAYYYLGVVKAEDKDYYDALKNLDKAIAINCTNSDYYNARGYVKTMIWDTTAALKDLNMSLSINGSNANAYYNRSVLWLNTKKFDRALQDCNKAISIQPTFYELFQLRGHIKLMEGDSAGAKNDFEFIISKDSENIAAYYNLALYYHDKKDYTNALKYYTRVTELNPYNSECYFNRAASYAENNHYAEAAADYSNVIRINPDNLMAYFYRAELRRELKDIKGAIDDYSTVIKLFPMFYQAYFMRSLLYRETNNYKGYISDKKMAESLMNSNDSTLFSEEEIKSLKHLFEFRTELESSDTTQGKIQYKPYDIISKPVFYLTYTENKLTGSPTVFNAQVAELNSGNQDLQLVFSHDNGLSDARKLAGEKKLTDSISSGKKHDDKYLIRGSLLSGLLYNYNEALTMISNVGDSSDYSYLSWFIRGNLHFEMGRNNESDQKSSLLFMSEIPSRDNGFYYQSIKDYTVAIEKNARFTYSYFNRAFVKSVLNDYSSALLDYSVCIFYDPSFAEAYFNRGLLYLFLGNKEKGCADISKAGELGIKESYNVLYKYCKE